MTTWIVLRAAGIGAYLMLFASVAWGMVATTSLVGKRVAKVTAISVHQFIATVAVVLLGVHLGGLLLDRFIRFRPLDLVIPLYSSFRPIPMAFGVLAMYATVTVLASSWLRNHMNTKTWRRIHLLAVPAFTMSMLHGVFAGTDTARPLMWWVYIGTGSITVFLLIVRGLTAGLRPVRAAHPERPARPARPAEPAVARPAAHDEPAEAPAA